MPTLFLAKHGDLSFENLREARCYRVFFCRAISGGAPMDPDALRNSASSRRIFGDGTAQPLVHQSRPMLIGDAAHAMWCRFTVREN